MHDARRGSLVGGAIRLMIKYQNLHLMTSAWAPKYLPESLLHFMRDAGQDEGHLRL